MGNIDNHEMVTEAVIETTEVIDLMVDDQEEIDHIMIDCQSEAEFMNQLMTGDNKNLEEFINKEGTAMITKFNTTEEDALIEEIDKEIDKRKEVIEEIEEIEDVEEDALIEEEEEKEEEEEEKMVVVKERKNQPPKKILIKN